MKMLLFLCALLLIPMCLGLEFDNIKSYDDKNKEVTITNAFGLGDDIAKIKLNTPINNYVIQGQDRLVAEFTIDNYENYNNVFNSLEFYNLNNLKEFERNFNYKYKDYYDVSVDDYEEVCKKRINKNGTISYYDCLESKTGSHTEQRFNWIEYNEKSLIKGIITIGIFTNVYRGDYVEWIPTLYGERINEWAVWSEAFEVGLWEYHNLDEGTGTFSENYINPGTYDWNAPELKDSWDAVGLIGSSYNVTPARGVVKNTANVFGQPAGTLNFWIKRNGRWEGRKVVEKAGGGNGDFYSIAVAGSNTLNFYAWGGAGLEYGGTPMTISGADVWNMWTWTWNNTYGKLYINAGLIDGRPYTNFLPSDKPFSIFGATDGSNFTNSSFDEIGIWNRTLSSTEVTDLYNAGSGIAPVGKSATGDILFSDDLDFTTYKTVFDEGEDFIVWYNWTDDADSLAINKSYGECNITLIDGLEEVNSVNDNFTICGLGCDYSTYSETFSMETTVNAVMDMGHALVCNEQLQQQDAEVNISCNGGVISYYETRSGAGIPLCSVGTSFVSVNTSVCIGYTDIDVSVTYDGIFNRRKRILDLALDREYSTHLQSGADGWIEFNETYQLWKSNHTHEYYKNGEKTIYANCSHDTESDYDVSTIETITIVNILPQILNSQMTNKLGTFVVNGTLAFPNLYEYVEELWNWSFSIVDDDIDTHNETWYNRLGDVLQSYQHTGDEADHNTTTGLFANFTLSNIYNVTVWANDTNSNRTIRSFYFNVTPIQYGSFVTKIIPNLDLIIPYVKLNESLDFK